MNLKFSSLLAISQLLLATLITAAPPQLPNAEKIFQQAVRQERNGNYREALVNYRKICLANNPQHVGAALRSGINCMQRLNRVNEIDQFLEDTIKVHANDWNFLRGAAKSYLRLPHYGYLISGKFERGYHRGGGKYTQCYQRDRVRALQLYDRARKLAIEQDAAHFNSNSKDIASLLVEFADAIRQRNASWRLQYLTDLTTLPDYGDAGDYGTHYAPVDAAGQPVFYKLPKNYAAAANDGERWRALLAEAQRANPELKNRIDKKIADFAYSQFSVQTLRQYRWFFYRPLDNNNEDTLSAAWQVNTLDEDETMARLATGIKRFSLPKDYDFILIYRRVADESSLNRLAQIFENRRQYDKARAYWKKSISKYGDSNNHWKQKRIDQITKNWGRFEYTEVTPAGKDADFQFRFRNAKEVHFTARRIDVPKLLNDVKAYLEDNPRHLKYEKTNISNIGWRLVREDGKKYLREKVADWSEELEPAEGHYDKRVTLTAPIKKPGAYLLQADVKDGNTSYIIIWLSNTTIVQKRLATGKPYYFVADAATGRPVPNATVEFFGYRQEYINHSKRLPGGRTYNLITTDFTEKTDANGEFVNDRYNSDYNWLVTATVRDTNAPPDEVVFQRFAYLGFDRFWSGRGYDRDYEATKTFVITDRPVYRPNQNVKFKVWIRHAQYDKPDTSQFANKKFQLQIRNPRGEKILERQITTDAWGGYAGEFPLPQDAMLGVYRIMIDNYGRQGTFRVEEYKKPEFEVTVEAPRKPIALGDKIEAKVKAKYYFGAPVTDATVKIKVTRKPHNTRWYPVDPWDWFYGNGYWWFDYDYTWYPGWYKWGCARPYPIWAPYNPGPPELVAESEQKIGKDGTVTVTIDTAQAKAMHGDQDHAYTITAEVTDKSRRTIVGNGQVIAARQPFKVYAWTDRGYYLVNDTITASFSARTPDGKPVTGGGTLTLYRISYDAKGNPQEKEVSRWNLATDTDGHASQKIKAADAGQYRVSYKLTDAARHSQEGASIFTVMGEQKSATTNFRFNAIELVPEKRHYAPNETVKLRVNTARANSTVLLFIRPTNGYYHKPRILRLDGKTGLVEIPVTRKDMPNFFVEALTVSDARVHTTVREIAVPPEKRILDLKVTPLTADNKSPKDATYRPGATARLALKLTDSKGRPFVGSTVISVYDKAVEYISGGSNVPDIKAFFWKWRHHHNPRTTSNTTRRFNNIPEKDAPTMRGIGIFGNVVADNTNGAEFLGRRPIALACRKSAPGDAVLCDEAPVPMSKAVRSPVMREKALDKAPPPGRAATPQVQPHIRTKFADTAFWTGSLTTDSNGIAKVDFKLPENLTTWKIRSWAMGPGTRVGEATTEIITSKPLLLRMQAPRFFVEKDIVVLTANIHNYLKHDKQVTAILELDGPSLEPIDPVKRVITIKAGGEARVNWRVRAVKEGAAVIRMKALTDEESDAMQKEYPVYVHGMLKTESWSGVIRQNQTNSTITIQVPQERRINQTRLEIRYSPTLAGAMVDALPYLVDYPYGCTEQTLNRFLPTVITRNVLRKSGIDLKAIQQKRTNLNSQEIGDDRKRAAQWKRKINPVFDQSEVDKMVKAGVERLASMQNRDGGWGWFYGSGEHSFAHTTATVVHGLQLARANGVPLKPGLLEMGLKWLRHYQDKQVDRLTKRVTEDYPRKRSADNLDALVFMVLNDSGIKNDKMRDYLYRDRNRLSVYAKCLYALALYKLDDADKLAMLKRNIEQYLVFDNENQTAWLKLGNGGYWWYWYGSEYEAQAYYLKLLAKTDPRNPAAPGLVKYLLNNRKHATYWNSTRDTAICIEAMADYLAASGEAKPDMQLDILVDGSLKKSVTINSGNLFSYDNKLVLEGSALSSGKHTIELRRHGQGPVYFNAYLTNFTIQDNIKHAGLEIKVRRAVYKLVPIKHSIKVAGARGQALDQRVEKYKRVKLHDYSIVNSGDLIEVELNIDSKNDYEYIMFEDMKAAGFEAVNLRSGYIPNDLGAYVEFRDNRVVFMVRRLAHGHHSVSYRLRAEIPGSFSALPAKASAMYAPELKGNSDEIKLTVAERK